MKSANLGSTLHAQSSLVPIFGTNGEKFPVSPVHTSTYYNTVSQLRHAVIDGVSHSLPRFDAQGYSASVVNHLTKARAKTTFSLTTQNGCYSSRTQKTTISPQPKKRQLSWWIV